MTARFPRRARLLKPAQFKAVFARGLRVHERGLTAIAAANDVGQPRLGLAISKKAVALAVERNRIKRQIRESFRLNQQRLPSADLVVLVKPGARTPPSAQLGQNLERLWTRICASSVVSPASSPSR